MSVAAEFNPGMTLSRKTLPVFLENILIDHETPEMAMMPSSGRGPHCHNLSAEQRLKALPFPSPKIRPVP